MGGHWKLEVSIRQLLSLDWKSGLKELDYQAGLQLSVNK